MSGKRRRGEYGRGGNRFFAGAQNDKRALGMTERVHVRREDATQGVSQGLVAQMSGEMRRSAQTGCHTKRISMVACTHVGRRRRGEYGRGGNRFFAGAQNDRMGARNDRRVFWETERGHVRVEDATQGVSQGLAARMSVWELRCVQGKLEIRRGRGIGCADVGRNAEKCADGMPYKAYIDCCLHTCREKEKRRI